MLPHLSPFKIHLSISFPLSLAVANCGFLMPLLKSTTIKLNVAFGYRLWTWAHGQVNKYKKERLWHMNHECAVLFFLSLPVWHFGIKRAWVAASVSTIPSCSYYCTCVMYLLFNFLKHTLSPESYKKRATSADHSLNGKIFMMAVMGTEKDRLLIASQIWVTHSDAYRF